MRKCAVRCTLPMMPLPASTPVEVRRRTTPRCARASSPRDASAPRGRSSSATSRRPGRRGDVQALLDCGLVATGSVNAGDRLADADDLVVTGHHAGAEERRSGVIVVNVQSASCAACRGSGRPRGDVVRGAGRERGLRQPPLARAVEVAVDLGAVGRLHGEVLDAAVLRVDLDRAPRAGCRSRPGPAAREELEPAVAGRLAPSARPRPASAVSPFHGTRRYAAAPKPTMIARAIATSAERRTSLHKLGSLPPQPRRMVAADRRLSWDRHVCNCKP